MSLPYLFSSCKPGIDLTRFHIFMKTNSKVALITHGMLCTYNQVFRNKSHMTVDSFHKI